MKRFVCVTACLAGALASAYVTAQAPRPNRGGGQASAAQRQRPSSGGNSRTINVSQPYYGGGYDDGYHSSTAAEGAQRGMADIIRSQGQANLNNSEAAINWTQAQKQDMENQQQWTETYFEMRKINRDARAAERGPPASHDAMVRWAKESAPKRLSPSELDPFSGKIGWPIALRADQYDARRAKLDKSFAERVYAHGGIGPETYESIQENCRLMRTDLKKDLGKISDNDYIGSKRFLESLAYEARFPVQ